MNTCAGCIGRGTGDVCRMCDQPILERMRLGPDMPGRQGNPALDGWAFNLALELLMEPKREEAR
ncbi:hypothetical protein Ade02nite_21000 [Paractinoplanes deccanensis]|uniref:Uncharacterized protein n=1 Tax=Paractinoplanes deccanensis TaxID=113561 RepID=A0ABQ3Y0D6_9ACTN|nr:hypothetical protein Ade02nite_21000 [Actinoplanes deccanensis]